MTHVQIKIKKGGAAEVLVDGIDLAPQILHEGFGVTFPERHGDPVRVSMILAACDVDLDFPDAVIEALRGTPEQNEVSA